MIVNIGSKELIALVNCIRKKFWLRRNKGDLWSNSPVIELAC